MAEKLYRGERNRHRESNQSQQFGYMRLLVKRLENAPFIEMIANQRIKLNQSKQKKTDGITGITYPGYYGLGARDPRGKLRQIELP